MTRHPSIDQTAHLVGHWSAIDETTGNEIARGVTEIHLAEIMDRKPAPAGHTIYAMPTRIAAESYSMVATLDRS